MTQPGSMLRFLKQPVALAILLSLLIHATLLLGPNLIQLRPVQSPPPPLIARLEPLPKLAPKPVKKPIKKHVRKFKPHPKPVTPAPVVPPLPTSAPSPEIAASETPPAPAVDAASAPVQTPDMADENSQPAYPLPKHAQLTFAAYLGADFKVGEARYRLDVKDDKSYTLQVAVNTTGIASLFKTFDLNQQSTGTITARGIRPDKFSETRLTSKGKEVLSADFDWQNQRLQFSSGNSSPLPDQAQDLLSFLFQFSQMPLDQARLPMRVSNGKKLESYELEVGEEEEIQTRLGKMRALPLRKVHAPGEEGLEIWLGLEYRLLPVKIRYIDKDGKSASELVISEIRVSDE